MNTITLKSKTMSPRNVTKNVVEGNPELLSSAVEFFKGACRSVVGYKQLQTWLNDHGHNVVISYKKFEFNGPLFQRVEDTQEDEFAFDNGPAQIQEIITEVSEMNEEVDQEFLNLLEGTTTPVEEVRFPEVPEEHRELFIIMVDNGVPYQDAWTTLVDPTDQETLDDISETFDEQGYRQEFTFKVAVSQLQSILYSYKDNTTLDATQYDMQLSSNPKSKGTYKLSKVMNEFYKNHKELLSDDDRKQLVEFMVQVNEQFTALCDSVKAAHNNYWFVSSSKVVALPAFSILTSS